ncbi:hypothetical protein JCM4814A_94190 [Streptomyces phaeofaciens JCM 4814]|uniref:Uncharacterized protein n=1 Tax=Streptomyces phaeofaciens TaxID=68254 RepID=A0A918M1A0_9ACTN|nr:hypothetical protein GCM10010226_90820 [Streptomyces phaeofaciens]
MVPSAPTAVQKVSDLSVSDIVQIVSLTGRAGRSGSQVPIGTMTLRIPGELAPFLHRLPVTELALLTGQLRVLVKRAVGPQPSRAGVMHHVHSGLPPWPYLCVLRWHTAQGPTWLPRQTKADGSGSESEGGGVFIV